MNQDAIVVLVLSLALAVVMTSTGVAGRNGTLPLNSILGIRTNMTRKSEEAWNAAHRAAWPFNFLAASCFAITGLVAAFLVDGQQAASTAVIVGWGAGMLATGAAVFVARRAAVRALGG